MTEPCDLSARELLAEYRARTLSPLEVVDAALDRIEDLDGVLGAFNTVCAERARAEARVHARGYGPADQTAPLAGVPFAVKDLLDTAGVRTTYGSPMFDEHLPAADAVAVGRVREAGGILVGKAQTHEFAWGITSVNELTGTSRNPWSADRISGGSSGGCAVALAANMVPLAIGSDTGGSIRVPSALCGTVGFKPTYGRVSVAGALPLAPSLDHVGAMARTPADAALLLSAMDGTPPRADDDGLAGLTVAVCPDLHLAPLTSPVQAAFDAAVAAITDAGAEVVELRLPEADTIHPAFVVIQRAEALRSHVRAGLWPDRRDEYGDDVRGRLEAAEHVTLDDYLEATSTRERMRSAVLRLFGGADLLLTPAVAGPPPLIADERRSHTTAAPGFREGVMPYTVPHDLLGLPACAVRAGFDELDIPVGVQLGGPPWSDRRVLAAAAALFDATAAVQRRRPSLGATVTGKLA